MFHRDNKPQNFLIDDNRYLVISDLGLGLEPDSPTRLTNTSQYWMTEGYYPPEFTSNGFKYADETSDIFMLGKTIYALLTRGNPTYLSTHANIYNHLLYILHKACSSNKQDQYRTALDMKQDITTTYDMILQRKGVTANLEKQLEAIIKNTEANNLKNIKTFIQNLRCVDSEESFLYQISTPNFFLYFTDFQLQEVLQLLHSLYADFLYNKLHPFVFAETVVNLMTILIEAPNVTITNKRKALELSINFAENMNRYAAMNTCCQLIYNITDENLAQQIINMMRNDPTCFINDISAAHCKSPLIRDYLETISANYFLTFWYIIQQLIDPNRGVPIRGCAPVPTRG
ncbi:protein kinase domain-containing protein [Commensalibacter communis]|uniref:protein kinase domain-containing protein n=1 Tax=Commensalibacter communis TaxID=2972786 RepID=UPI00232ABC02|nr:protein kinase [Commensalibacter communis]